MSDPLFKNTSLSLAAGGGAASVPLLSPTAVQDSSDEFSSDERTSFVRAKSHRKYGSTTISGRMNAADPTIIRYHHHHPSMAYIQHQVQPGDTLVGIALKYQTTMECLKRINKMWNSDTLFLRSSLLVPSPQHYSSTENHLEAISKLVLENEINGGTVPTLEASCSQQQQLFPNSNNHTLFSPVSLDSVQLQAKTSSPASLASSNTSIDCDKSIQDYLGSIDNQIKEAKSRAQTLQKSSDVMKEHSGDGFSSGQSSWPSRSNQASSRLRMSLSDLGGEFNAATTTDQLPSTAVVGGNTGRNSNKSRGFSFHSRERSQDEIFEL